MSVEGLVIFMCIVVLVGALFIFWCLISDCNFVLAISIIVVKIIIN